MPPACRGPPRRFGLSSGHAAAIGLLASSAADDDGRVADVFGVGVDRVRALLLVAITGTGAVVAGFSRRSVDDEARTSRYFALVTLVVGASTLVVLPGPALALALGWLASGWALTLLIGWQPGWETARRAQRRILSTLAVGDVALIAALIALVSVDAGGATRGDAGATALRWPRRRSSASKRPTSLHCCS